MSTSSSIEQVAGDHRQLKRFLFVRKPVRCTGWQMVFVDAESRAEAERELTQKGGKLYHDSIKVSELSPPAFRGETHVDDFGPTGSGYRVPTPDEVGAFVDSVPGALRNGARVRDLDDLAARALDEMVELALACGMQPGDIFACIADSLSNQALKRSLKEGNTVFPSEIGQQPDRQAIASELAGTSAALKDLAFVARVSIPAAEAEHWKRLQQQPRSAFYADGRGTLRQRKPHVITSLPASKTFVGQLTAAGST